MSAREKKALLTHWLAQKKTTERERETANEELELWFKRARLALDHGDLELARAAKDKAGEAREAYRRATARLVEIEAELDSVRAERTIPGEDEAELARRRAEHAADEFRKLGIDPRFAALKEAGLDQGLDDLLGRGPEPASEAASDVEQQDAWAEADALLDEPLDHPTPDPPEDHDP